MSNYVITDDEASFESEMHYYDIIDVAIVRHRYRRDTDEHSEPIFSEWTEWERVA